MEGRDDDQPMRGARADQGLTELCRPVCSLPPRSPVRCGRGKTQKQQLARELLIQQRRAARRDSRMVLAPW